MTHTSGLNYYTLCGGYFASCVRPSSISEFSEFSTQHIGNSYPIQFSNQTDLLEITKGIFHQLFCRSYKVSTKRVRATLLLCLFTKALWQYGKRGGHTASRRI